MNNKTKILLVEDEATLAVIVRDTLKLQGFEVITADNGEQGLQMFNTRSLHVFITKLRRKLSRDPRVRIINVRGIGYKLIG